MEKIILIKPNSKNNTYGVLKNISAIEPPLWAIILANYYKNTIGIIDAEVDDLDHNQIIKKNIEYKSTKIILIPTGNHPSSFIHQKDEAIKLKEKLLLYTKNIEVLDKLPVSPIRWNPPRWDLIDLNKYHCHNWHSFTNNLITNPYGVIYTSISCPMKCDFCAVKSYYPQTFEQRLIEDIVADFKVMKDKNVKNIKIMDELFIFNPNRAEIICDEIIKLNYEFNIWAYARIDIMNEKLLQKMRKAGIRWLAYGIESGSEKIRKDVLKGNFTNEKIKDVIKLTKDNDIAVIGNFMFGFQEDDLSTMQETLDLAFQLNCEYVNFYCVSAYPNTPLYEEIKAKNLLDLPSKWSEYSQTSEEFKPLATKYLSGKEVLNFRDDAFYRYFSNPTYLNSISQKFGSLVRKEIENMTTKTIKRIYG